MTARRRRASTASRRRRAPKTTATLGFEGFHVLVADTNARVALVTARNAVDHVLGNAGGWRIVLLPAATREFRLVPAVPEHAPALAEAWELARALQRERGIEAAEVALIGPGLQPPHPTRHLAPSERTAALAKSFDATKDLKCSAPCDWHVARIHAPAAWALPNAKGAGVTVAHPDTGYTLHPEIWSPTPSTNRIRAEEGFDFVGGDGDPLDDLVGSSWTLEMPGHGTATASVIMSTPGAQTNPHPGGPTVPFVTGVAPEAELVPIRVSTSVIHLSYANLVDGLRYAIAGGHHVVSMSLGGPLPSDALERAVHDAVAAGMILIAAAGNYYPFVVFPAALDAVIAVAATNCRDEPWEWSAAGPAVDLSAPGESIWIARSAKGKGYKVERSSGTSFATAATAGAAATWLSHHGRDNLIALYGKTNLSRVFKRVLTTSGAVPPAEWDATRYGAGILDVDALLRAPLPVGAPPSPKVIAPTTAAHRLDRIANFFPTLAPDEVRRGVAALLRTSPEAVEEALDDVGHELAAHIAVDPSLREAIHRAARPAEPLAVRKGTRAAKKTPTRYAESAHLRATASKRLRARIGTPTPR